MKKKEIKLKIFLLILIFLFITFLIIIFKPYNYTKIYNLNNFKITENYNKDLKYYKFILEKDDITYSYIIDSKYNHNRKLINDILISNDENEECILPKSKKQEFYPLCSKDNEVYTYNLSNIKDFYNYKKIENINDKYNNIEINYLNDKKYLLFNYKGFYLLDNKSEIKIFDNDIYNMELIYEYDNNLLIPDYNSSYYFNKFYIINMLNGKLSELKLDNEISFNSVFLGDYKNNIYLLDKKEEKEYKINIKKKKVEETEFLILENNKLIKTNYRNIVNNNLVFNKEYVYNYEIVDNVLYEIIDNNKIKLSNKNVQKIIKKDNNTVYFLVNDNLYMYNNIYGEVLLINNFEWNFNNTNMIFISK